MTKHQEMIQAKAVEIIQEYGEYRKFPEFMQGMEDYRNGKAWGSYISGVAGQAYDRGAEAQMRINRMIEKA